MIKFYVKASRIFLARERGQTVIAYVNSRIMHANLGLWKCRSPRDIFLALGENSQLEDLTLPVAITSGDWNSTNICYKNGIYRGNVLTLIYARRDLSSGTEERILTIKTGNTNSLTIGPGKTVTFKVFVNDNSIFSNSDFTNDTSDFHSWSALAGAGIPAQINFDINGANVRLSLPDTAPYSADVPPVCDLLYLECEKFFVGTDSMGEKNFMYRQLFRSWNDTQSRQYSHEGIILELYMEFNTNTKIFDLYVLASGGHEDSLNAPRPSTWPDFARWLEEYSDHEVYVSRASWKLHNIPDSFTWN